MSNSIYRRLEDAKMWRDKRINKLYTKAINEKWGKELLSRRLDDARRAYQAKVDEALHDRESG